MKSPAKHLRKQKGRLLISVAYPPVLHKFITLTMESNTQPREQSLHQQFLKFFRTKHAIKNIMGVKV